MGLQFCGLGLRIGIKEQEKGVRRFGGLSGKMMVLHGMWKKGSDLGFGTFVQTRLDLTGTPGPKVASPLTCRYHPVPNSIPQPVTREASGSMAK